MTSPSARTPLERDLRAAVRGTVGFDAATRARYATDASIYQIMPHGVVAPRDDADLFAALEVARAHGAPVLARGAGSSQCGQTVGEALIVDVSQHLCGIHEIDVARRRARVDPGVVLDRLNAALRPHGLIYPVDVSTSAQATLGGMAGNNSCGSRSLLYGNMVHNVEAIDAILADGRRARFGTADGDTAAVAHIRQRCIEIMTRSQDEIRARVPRMLRRVGGYNIDLLDPQSPKPYRDDGALNLAQLLVGSEGTLAFTSQLTLRLSALPRTRVLGVVNCASLYQAMEMTAAIVALKPSAVELVDRTMIDLALGNPAFRPVLSAVLRGDPGALLLVEFSHDESTDLRPRLAELDDVVGARQGTGNVVALIAEAEQKALWEVRKAGLNIMMSMKGDGKPVSFIEDCAVPLEHLAEYTESLSEVFRRHGTAGTWYAHASVGTLHVRPILDMRRDGAVKMRAIAEEAAALVRRFKGAYSGEHGDGLCRGEWIRWQFGPRLCAEFAEIKRLFDSAGRFAPDKMQDAPKMDDARNFRFSPHYQVIALTPALDWSSFDFTRDAANGHEGAPGSGGDPSHGLAMAVEMCNNNGHCRKFDAGTMCPSYRVTRDERDVTRGRANTLRLALSGQLGADGLASDEVHDTLDLCVSCKGCRRECPTGVDMARIKIEARAAWNARVGTPRRERLLASLPTLAPFITQSAWRARLFNRLTRHAPQARGWLGFSRARALPQFRRSFLSETTAGPAQAPTLVLWIDTFNNHFEPDILRAAMHVLTAIGESVQVVSSARPLCCGRTALAAGDVTLARQRARDSLAALMPYVRAGCSVIGLEPSCLLTMRDEWQILGLGDDARACAEVAFLLEEYLARPTPLERLQHALRAQPAAAPRTRHILVHGHCHQKAFGTFAALLTVLAQLPHAKVEAIESSCCGMAGSFGLEAEHEAVSRAMGELTLAPSIRQAPDAEVVACGTSCRQLMATLTGLDDEHLAVVLAQALTRS